MNPLALWKKVIESGESFFSIIARAIYRFYYDDGFSRAAALAYTTLFAMVPVTALSILMYSAFGVDREQVGHTLEKILDQLLPPTVAVEIVETPKADQPQVDQKPTALGKLSTYNVKTVQNEQLIRLRDEVTKYLLLLADHARTLGVLTLATLFFIGISLLNTIESALNTVWRTTSNLSIASKVLSFWAVITLGPLLIGLSIYWTTKAYSFGLLPLNGGQEYGLWYKFGAPVFVSTAALSLLFFKLPAAYVRFRDALLGATISAVLFEFVKIGFSYYLIKSSGYSALYGFIVTVPLFLFWLYLAWVVVLYGAEVSYLSKNLHIIHGLKKYSTDLGEIGVVIGLRTLLVIGQRFAQGDSAPTESEIAVETGSDPVLIRTCLNVLSDANVLSAFDPSTKTRTLQKPLDKIAVSDVVGAFRTKKYRATVKDVDEPIGESYQIGRDVYLLDTVRLRALKTNDMRSVSDWTLADLIHV